MELMDNEALERLETRINLDLTELKDVLDSKLFQPKTKENKFEDLGNQGAKLTGESWRSNWQTPQIVFDKVNEFFGEKNWSDPCPPKHTIDALSKETLENYLQYFKQNVYINPPFSNYAEWVDVWSGLPETKQIWLLPNSKTETKYGQKLLERADAVCFVNRRLKFIHPLLGTPMGSGFSGQLLIYINNECDKFTNTDIGYFDEVFSSLGVTHKFY